MKDELIRLLLRVLELKDCSAVTHPDKFYMAEMISKAHKEAKTLGFDIPTVNLWDEAKAYWTEINREDREDLIETSVLADLPMKIKSIDAKLERLEALLNR